MLLHPDATERDWLVDPCKVFYSWQSDLPNATNRGFIQKALEDAAKSIRDDQTIQVEPVVDRDTAGVAGSPDIAQTILQKIDQAQVFVCDVSIVNAGNDGRLTPNPNVLIELGYAVNQLGIGRILMVMNTAFGEPEQLPFDLRMKRVVTYNMPREAEERAPERRKLQAILDEGLRAILAGFGSQEVGTVIQPTSAGEQAKVAVETSQVSQLALVRKYMEWLAAEINNLAPDLSKTDQREVGELLIQGINKTERTVAEFARVVEAIAILDAKEVAEAVYRGFGPILEGYYLPSGFSGHFLEWQFDFHKFIGYELFVVFTARLLHEGRWETLADLLGEGIYVPNVESGLGGLVPYTYASAPVILLGYRNNRLGLGKPFLHADLLHERHTKGELGQTAPMSQFMEADCVLFLRSELGNVDAQRRTQWNPWSTVCLRQSPGS